MKIKYSLNTFNHFNQIPVQHNKNIVVTIHNLHLTYKKPFPPFYNILHNSMLHNITKPDYCINKNINKTSRTHIDFRTTATETKSLD